MSNKIYPIGIQNFEKIRKGTPYTSLDREKRRQRI